MTTTDTRWWGDDMDAALSEVVETREDIIEAVVRFVRVLRAGGVAVPADGVITATEALAEVGYTDKATVRAATKASLVSHESDVDIFDRLFEGFWRELGGAGSDPLDADPFDDVADPPGSDLQEEYVGRTDGEDDPDRDGDRDRNGADIDGLAGEDSLGLSTRSETADGDAGDPVETARYSPAGGSERVERTVLFDRYALAEPVAQLTRAVATLPGRRRKRTHSGRYVDARRALRNSFQTGGVVASLPESERAESDVRGTVLVDVSQSVLDTVDRGFLLEWLRLLAAEWRSIRVFFFDTDLREVTDAFDERTVGDVSDALARAEAAWGGGTRIGDAFGTVRQAYPDAVDHRTVVLVVSDGLERGEVDDLERGAAWLSRRARLLLWLNPLAASPSYEPVARGMAAALPAIDGLFAFAGPDDVAELARQLDRHDRTRLGYEYDPRLAEGPDAAGPDADGPVNEPD